MSKSLSVGDLVEVIDSGQVYKFKCYIGREAEVIAGPITDYVIHPGPYYRIKFNDGRVLAADPKCLRKRPRPPNWLAIASRNDVDDHVRSEEVASA